MPRRCTVRTCQNYYKKRKNIRFFKFPQDADLRALWLAACHLSENRTVDLDRAVICSIHFGEDAKPLKQIVTNIAPLRGRVLKKDAVPTLNLPESRLNTHHAELTAQNISCNELQEDLQEEERLYLDQGDAAVGSLNLAQAPPSLSPAPSIVEQQEDLPEEERLNLDKGDSAVGSLNLSQAPPLGLAPSIVEELFDQLAQKQSELQEALIIAHEKLEVLEQKQELCDQLTKKNAGLQEALITALEKVEVLEQKLSRLSESAAK